MALLGGAQVRQLCEMLDLHPSKNLGQNFVTDPGTVRSIARQALLDSHDHVLEIGPGLGSLTLALLETPAAVSAVELDNRMANALPVTVKAFSPQGIERLRVLYQDALGLTPEELLASNFENTNKHVEAENQLLNKNQLLDENQVFDKTKNSSSNYLAHKRQDLGAVVHCGKDALLEKEPTVVVANLPYRVAVPLVLNILHRFPSVKRMFVMVQEEVADRLAATPGSRIYGIPSVKLAWWATARKTMKIGTQVFYPQPKVQSALLEINRLETPNEKNSNGQEYTAEEIRQCTFNIVEAAFSQRRKGLRKALAKIATGPEGAENLLKLANINPLDRAENLSVKEFTNIAIAQLNCQKDSKQMTCKNNTLGKGK